VRIIPWVKPIYRKVIKMGMIRKSKLNPLAYSTGKERVKIKMITIAAKSFPL